MSAGDFDPATQIDTLTEWLDNLTPGPTLEAQTKLQGVIHAILTAIALQWDATGSTKWYQDPAAATIGNFSIKQAGDKPLAYPSRVTPGTNDFTIPAGPDLPGVLIDAAKLVGGSGIIAVGASSTQDGAYVAATEANFTTAGTLGVGLSTAVDIDGRVVNLAVLLDAATNDPVLDAGTQVYGLVQSQVGVADGTAVAAAASENLQLSFAKFDPGTDALVAVDLPAGSYHFGLTIQRAFRSLALGALMGGAVLPDVIDPGADIPRQPCREFAVIGPGPGNQGPASQDPMDIQTGAFVTAGAGATQTDATFGTTNMPASAADFVNDDRYEFRRNGKVLSKGANFASGKEVFYVSTVPPRVGFRDNLRIGDNLYVKTA